MAIKYLNNNVNIINYEDKDVKKVILDSDIVWCKPFTYTIGTLPTGVASLTCTRYSNDEPSASTGTIANGGTIYYGDTLYWSATATTGYNNPTVTYDGSTAAKRYTVVGNVTGVTASGVQAGSIKTYTITLNSTYGHWENASGTTVTSTIAANYGTAVSVSGNVLTVGSATYTFVINSDTAQYDYEFDSITGAPASITGTSTVTGTATRTTKQYTITWRYRTAYNTWINATTVYEYGATPLIDSPVSGIVPTPSTQTSGNYRYAFKEWPGIVEVTQNKQYQADYYYQFNITSVTTTYTNAYKDSGHTTTFNTGWYNSNTIIYWVAKTNYYYSSSGTTTSTSTVVAGTNTNNPTYLKATISSTRCTPSPASGSIVAVGSDITWTASSGYSFAAGTSQSATATATVVLGTLNYSKSADYKYVTITNTNCTSDVATGYRQLNTTITWTPNTGTNYKYSFTDTVNYDPSDAQRKTTATITTSTSSFTKSPSYRYYNVRFNYEYGTWLSELDGEEIVSDPSPTSDYVDEYHYCLGGLYITIENRFNDSNIHYCYEDDPLSTVEETYVDRTGIVINDNNFGWNFYHCTFSGTNTNASSQTNWYQWGDVVTITANSSTTYKYSFSYSPTIPETTKTHKVTTYGSFTYNANYIYYKITINPSDTGPTDYQNLIVTTSTSATTGTIVNTGEQWILSGRYIRAQALVDDTYNKYNFSNSSDTATKWITSSQITGSTTWNIPTMYKWIKMTSQSDQSVTHSYIYQFDTIYKNKFILCDKWSNGSWYKTVDLRGAYSGSSQLGNARFNSLTGPTQMDYDVSSGGVVTLPKARFAGFWSYDKSTNTKYNFEVWLPSSYMNQALISCRRCNSDGSYYGTQYLFQNHTNPYTGYSLLVDRWGELQATYNSITQEESDVWLPANKFIVLDKDSSQM